MAIFNASAVRSAPLRSVVDEGSYRVRIVSVKAGASKQKGTPCLNFDYCIEAGPAQVDGRIVEGKHVFQALYFGENHEVSDRNLRQLCVAAGVEIEDEEQVLRDLEGREVIIAIKHRDYNGEPQEDVKGYKKVSA